MVESDINCNCEEEIVVTKREPTLMFKDFKTPLISALLLAFGILSDTFLSSQWSQYLSLFFYITSYLFSGFEVLKKAFSLLKKGDFFNEFVLMSLATIGAFYIGEYIEGVAVMLFYTTGEIIQGGAVRAARNNIRDLLELQIKKAVVLKDGIQIETHPEEVKIGDILLVKPGELIPLDGKLISEETVLNTANITGESVPVLFKKEEEVLAGMIATESSLTIKVNKSYDQSHISKIMHMVEEASARKAKTQRMIGRLAKVYTPIVFFLAVALIFVPWFFDEAYTFDKWLYRGLVFLVISCPCAFLIAIPLSYFGGIGLAARQGILFKGGEVIESLTKLKAIVFDKTGTVTDGKFKIDEIDLGEDQDLHLAQLIALESHSTHPLARAVINELKSSVAVELATDVNEYPGKGISGKIGEDLIMAGNYDWFNSEGIVTKNITQNGKPAILLAVNKKFVGSISFSDRLKTKSKSAFGELRKLGIDHLYILSGDKQAMADQIGNELEITKAFGELLPEEKVNEFLNLRKQHQPIGFVGDGVNDAPVLAVSDVGFAMGAAGSDAAIESADVVIENDDLTKISEAIKISKKTQRNVWQNLTLALVVKLVVLTLGAEGIATLWEAIFADVGVALLAVLNAYRLKFQ